MAWYNVQSLAQVLIDYGYPTPKRVAVTANYTMDGTEDIVAINSVGVGAPAYTVTLPLAASVPAGKHVIIVNEDGTLAGTNPVVAPVHRVDWIPQGTDTAEGGPGFSLQTAYLYGTLVSDGVSKWTQLYGPLGMC